MALNLPWSGVRALALAITLVCCTLLAPAGAAAAADVGIAPAFPSPLAVGAANVPGSITLTNFNSAPDGSLTLCNVGDAGVCTGSQGITLLPSCANQDFTLACTAPDPGVFAVDTPASGAAGTACQGMQFTVAVSDAATGKLTLTPTAGHVVLPAPGSACRIDLSIDVVAVPDPDRDAAMPGLQTVQIAETLGYSDQMAPTFARAQSSVTVKASPSLTTSASPGVTIGGRVSDAATLQGEHNPASGSVTFRLYGPADATCSGAPAFTSVSALAADGTATSADFEPAVAGTYRWLASYDGDAANSPATGACNDAGETVVVAKASPSLATTASPGVTIGGQVSDSATLGGEHNPTAGSVTFRLYGVGDTTCSSTPVFTSTTAAAAGGTATSDPFAPDAAGTYRWVASYGGDANNDPATGTCGDPGETVVIAKASPAIATTASPGVTIGGQVTDSATLTGEHNATSGNVTFRLYGPADAGCSGAPAFSSTVAIGAGGTATSAPFTPLATGSYRWIATYGGDANNNAAAGACNDAGESVAVANAAPTLSLTAGPGVAIGGQVTASATLAGEHNPTAGSVTFRLYEPGDTTCTAAPAFTRTVAIGADGTAASGPLTPAAPGTYRWVAAYGGDATNDAAITACDAPGSTVTVTKARPSIATNASAAVALGGQITDTATLTGHYGQTSGSVTFRLYAPADATCAGTAIFESSVAIGTGATATSQSFAPPAPGTYRWIASYAGDASNDAVAGACNDAGESVVVTKRSPSMTTVASPGRTIGGAISDTATLAGEHNPAAGSVTFRLYGPGDATCAAAPAFITTTAIDAAGTATSAEFTPSVAGTYRWTATYGGDAGNEPAAGACNDANESVVLAKASPSIATSASADVTIGGQVTDSATLADEHAPTGGSVTFRLYGPGDAGCSGSPVFTSTVGVDPGGTARSSAFEPGAVGTYRWIASYGGDASNAPAAGACNDAGETVTVTRRSPVLQTTASPSVTVGGAISDSATLTGELSPTGDVTFRLYGPGDETCATAALRSSTVPIDPGGTATSPPYTTSATGTYRWVATYGGDANHDPAAGACNDANESVLVTRARPSIATDASDSVVVGGQLSAGATLAGEYGPTSGSVTFALYGAQDALCSAAAVFTSTVPIGAGGHASSAPFTAAAIGTYRWIASYGGDARNESAAGACDDPGAAVTVTKAAPSIAIGASPSVAVGGTVSATASLGGEFAPAGGSVTFRLYPPGDPGCSGAPVFTSPVAVAAGGTATSAPYTAAAAGTYHWIASYGGDAANAPSSGSCNDPGGVVIVGTASPAIVTTASPAVDAGGSVSDVAMLLGAAGPVTGTVTFRLYGPDDATCTRAPVYESTVGVRPDGTAASAAFTPAQAGTYRWIARYGGDANNRPATGACNDPRETVTVRVAASPLLCGGTKVALVDVFPEGSRMVITGVAQPALAGKRARIVADGTSKTVVSALIGKDGSFGTTAKLPRKRIRASVRYRAIVGRSRSVALKLARRSYLTRAAARGSRATFRGKVTGAFEPGTKVTLLKITLCTKNTAIATTKLSRTGRWQITLPLSRNARDVLFRAKTTVLLRGRRHQTFTLPSPLSSLGLSR